MVTIAPVKGVKKPIRSARPKRIMRGPITQAALPLDVATILGPRATASNAITRRRIMMPIPGHESGKAKKSFCSWGLLRGKNRTAGKVNLGRFKTEPLESVVLF